MPAKRRVSLRQLDELLRLMEENVEVAKGNVVPGSVGFQRAQRVWEKVTKELNGLDGDGCTKVTKMWRQYWSDIKCKAKKRAVYQQQHTASSGGEEERSPLTYIDKRILNILGMESYKGNPSVQIPIGVETKAEVPPPAQELLPPAEDPLLAAQDSSLVSEDQPIPIQDPTDLLLLSVEESSEESDSRDDDSSKVSNKSISGKQAGQGANGTPREVGCRSQGRGRSRDPRPYQLNHDLPMWARRFEERRLRIDEQRAQSHMRIADVLEEFLPRIAIGLDELVNHLTRD